MKVRRSNRKTSLSGSFCRSLAGRISLCRLGDVAQDGGELDNDIKRLQSRRAGRRLVAVRRIGATASDRYIPELAEHLRDPNRKVREEAARALARIHSIDCLPPLISQLEDDDRGDSDVLVDAIESFGPKAEDRVSPLLAHNSPQVRINAVKIISRFHNEPPPPSLKPLRERSAYDLMISAAKFIGWLIMLLLLVGVYVLLIYSAARNPAFFADVMLRLALIVVAMVFFIAILNVVQRLIGDYLEKRNQEKRDELSEIINSFLKNPGDRERWNSLKAYAHDLATIELLAKSLSDEKKGALRQALIRMNAADFEEKRARHARRKWQRVQALQLLGWLGTSENLAVLREALIDPDTDIVMAAAEALANYETELAYLSLFNTLKDERLSRSRLAAMIESSQLKKPLPILTEQADDFRPRVRFWVAYLMGRTSDYDAFPVLSKMSGDEDVDVRAAAAEALGELGDKEAAPLLRKLLKDEHWPVRAHAAKAIGQLADEELMPDLLFALHDPHWWVRQNSVLALERFGPTAHAHLLPLLKDSDRFVRNKSAELLGRLGIISEQIKKLSGSPPEAKYAHDLLIAVGNAEAVNIIETQLLKTDPESQALIVDILGEIGSQKSLSFLEQLSRDGHKKVQAHARRAIDQIRGRTA